MSFSHKRVKHYLYRLALKNILKLISSIIVVSMFTGYLIRYGQDNSFELKSDIDRLDADIQRVTTYQVLAEKKWSEVANELERQGQKELANQVRELNKTLEKIRIKKEK